MRTFDASSFKKISRAGLDSSKGENGKLLIIAGSSLFHAAALWPCEVASRIVDLVFFSATPHTNKIFEESKEKFLEGIVVPREKLGEYVDEADCVLIGPGMMRSKEKLEDRDMDLSEIVGLKDEGSQAYYLVRYLLMNYRTQRFVIDGGALQMMNVDWLGNLSEKPILTPNRKEFRQLMGIESGTKNHESSEKEVSHFAKRHNCVVLLKGQVDIVCDGRGCVSVSGGNPGMTKGGTGDVLAGLVASLYCKNEAFLSAAAASYITKRAGDTLHNMVGPFFNASELAGEIPVVMGELLG